MISQIDCDNLIDNFVTQKAQKVNFKEK